MMHIIDNVEMIDHLQWQELLSLSSTRSFFQSRECYDLYKANDFMKPFCFAVEHNRMLRGVIVGFIQQEGGKVKRYLSRRAIINGGPLLANEITPDELTLLLTECRKRLKRKAIYVETRNFEDYSTYRTIFEQCGFNYKPHLNFHIDTTSEEVVEKNLGKSRKRDIRVTVREGAEIVENPTLEDIRMFYTVLYALYKMKVKTPLYPLSFFQYLFRQSYAQFLLVKYNGRIIGGTVCVSLYKYAVYEWFACGEDGKYKNIHASTLATFGGIRYAYTNGYPKFDMMGAGTPEDGYGVRDFKAKFGGKLVEHGRFVCVLNSLLYFVGCLGVKLIKKF